jgi:hypothetical protein
MSNDVSAADALKQQGEEARTAAEDAREENQAQPETEEEYYERIEAARATGIFGDTPTDPTIGDVVVPTSDEEAGGVNVSAADAQAEEDADDSDDSDDEPTEAEEQSSVAGDPTKAKRQDSAPAQEVQAASDEDDLSDVGRQESDENSDDENSNQS